MARRHRITKSAALGFSLIEMMIVLAILLTITASIFSMINMSTQRSSAEQTKLDMFQEAREFMDQMSRDLRQAGYPSPRNVDPSRLTQNPIRYDQDAAAGLVKIDTGDLWFEGDVDGTGTVSVVKYHLDTSTSDNCPCLKRSQLPKVDGDNLIEGTGGQTAASYQVEVQGVILTTGVPIFSAYNNGAAVGLPVTVASGSGVTMAGTDTVQAVLTLQAATVDPQTRKRPVTTLVTTVRLNNCSQAAIGYQTSCQ
jgi:prepilin-type N-terminal cleavage/methylation domain-containing protein